MIPAKLSFFQEIWNWRVKLKKLKELLLKKVILQNQTIGFYSNQSFQL